jgi:uncharacterized membrane protein
MKHLLILVPLLALAACGGNAPPQATVPTTPSDEHAHHHVEAAAEPAPADPALSTDASAAPPAPPAEAPDPKAELLASEQVAYEKARPVFEKYCARCHSQAGKSAKPKTLKHFDMTSYPFGGHHAAEIGTEVQVVLGLQGKKATMPLGKPGSVQGEELAAVRAWAEAFEKAQAAGAHGQRGHDAHSHAQP